MSQLQGISPISRGHFGFFHSLEQLEPGEKGVTGWSLSPCGAVVA